ncbi:MAG: DMT family transporter [Rhodobiaceae bacterium]|nr:DMT family transporter [Rhodobiaceae bacterium]
MRGVEAKANEDRAVFGIVLMLLAYFWFSFIDTSAKWLALYGFPVFQIVFMRYLAHLVISMGMIAKDGFELSRFGTEKPGLVILRGALVLGSTIFNFIAVRYLPLTLTSTILFSAPIIVCALSGPLLGEKVGLWRWSAIFAGFVGIVVAIRPFDASFHWAVFLSLGAAACFSFYLILTRKLAGVVASGTMQFYTGAVGALALAPLAFATWRMPETAFEWVVLVMIGFFGWIGHEFLTRAHGFAPASTLTPFAYSFILYLTVWSVFVFNQLPDRWTIIGAAIIVASGMVIWFRERKLGLRTAAARQVYPTPALSPDAPINAAPPPERD